MKRKLGTILTVATLTVLICYAGVRPPAVLWVDADTANIAEPKERQSTLAEQAFEGQFVEQWKQALDVPRLLRTAAGQPKVSANVNALDEVPSSSWYTNRHYLHRMTIEELVRGPDRGDPPDLTDAVITKVKTDGVTPGLHVKDTGGNAYLIKFDHAEYPELQSGAEIISTKILYAAGYNVPENYITYIDPDHINIGDKVEISDASKGKRPFLPDDLTQMLRSVARTPDGRYRVVASKILSGKPKGPFTYIGIRRDDPNDRIPHEHRRELRGLRVIASWINHWDLKEQNTLDMYVEENGRKFLRHYLIDFGSTLGGGKSPLEYYHGREYVFDLKSIVKEVFSLGAHTTAAEKQASLVSPAIGPFSSSDFDPAGWKPSLPVMAFDNMTDDDAFWATRVILSFSEAELRAIIETARYTDSRDADYLLETLLERRRIVASHWLRQVDAIADFSLEPGNETTRLTFRDLTVDCGCTETGPSEYRYQITSNGHTSKKNSTPERTILLDKSQTGPPGTIDVTIWAVRGGNTSSPVTVRLYRNAADDTFHLSGVRRG